MCKKPLKKSEVSRELARMGGVVFRIYFVINRGAVNMVFCRKAEFNTLA